MIPDMPDRHSSFRAVIDYAALAIALLYSCNELVLPYIEHDDFDWLNSPLFDQKYATPWSKTLSEGRWVNYLWSLASWHLSINQAFLIYFSLFSVCILIGSRLATDRWSAVAPALLLVSPMAAHLIMWPTTIIPAAGICALTLFAISRSPSFAISCAALFLGAATAQMSYPPFSQLLFVFFVARYGAIPTRSIVAALIYAVAYASSAMTVFVLNWFAHGHFGVIPEAWRKASPISAGGSFVANLDLYIRSLKSAWSQGYAYILIGMSAFAMCIILNIRRSTCLSLLLAGATLLSIDAATSIMIGFGLYLRSSIWVWAILLLPCLFLLFGRRTKFLGAALAAVFAVFGIASWQAKFDTLSPVFPAMDHIGQELALYAGNHKGEFDSIQTVGDVKKNPHLAAILNNKMAHAYLFKKFDLYVRPCQPAICLAADSTADGMFIVDRTIVLVLSGG